MAPLHDGVFMRNLTAHEITALFVSLAVLLASAKLLGELMRKLRQPPVMGEILAGILLGPTLLGTWSPWLYHQLFPAVHFHPMVLQTVTTLGIVLFLLTAGIEIDLSRLWHQGRSAFLVSTMGMVIPFGIGLAMGWFFPDLMGAEAKSNRLSLALFLGVALSISALPVIARILMDLHLIKSDLGTLVMVSAMINDLAGWVLFSITLSTAENRGHDFHPGHFGAGLTIFTTIAFAVLVLLPGRWVVNRALEWVNRQASYPGGVLGLVFSLALGAAAFTEYIGIHGIFGAFLVGVAIGDSVHLREHTREAIHQIVVNVLAPLFFATIGLYVNFIENFNILLVVLLLVLGTTGKALGCYFGAKIGGLDGRTSLAVAFAMNARGAMEIILGTLALQMGVIGERLFVGVVILALVTSMASGPLIRLALYKRAAHRLVGLLREDLFVANMAAATSQEAIRELATRAAATLGLDINSLARPALEREQVASSGLGRRVAVPHGHVPALPGPIVVLGFSDTGVDFNAPDGQRAEIIFLVLTRRPESDVQMELLAEIGHRFSEGQDIEPFIRARTLAEFKAAIQAQGEIESFA